MELTETDNDSWKMKSYIIGGMVGATVGMITAVMLVRNSDKKHVGPPEIEITEVLKLSIAAIALVRGIAALGD
jgi:gas vesicle protein